MKLVWTAAALADLDDILAYTAENYPALLAPLSCAFAPSSSALAVTRKALVAWTAIGGARRSRSQISIQDFLSGRSSRDRNPAYPPYVTRPGGGAHLTCW
jgi:plasmid stabilization system protein ParE